MQSICFNVITAMVTSYATAYVSQYCFEHRRLVVRAVHLFLPSVSVRLSRIRFIRTRISRLFIRFITKPTICNARSGVYEAEYAQNTTFAEHDDRYRCSRRNTDFIVLISNVYVYKVRKRSRRLCFVQNKKPLGCDCGAVTDLR